MAKVKGSEIVTGKVRLAYEHVLEKHSYEGQEAKYSATLLIPKEDKETLRVIKKAFDHVFESSKADRLKGVKREKVNTTLYDGDEETNEEGSPKHPGFYYLRASSKKKPLVLKIVNGTKIQTEDPDDVYSGVEAYVAINFYAYNTAGNKGISAGLNSILTLCKGDRFGGGMSADEAFGDIDLEDSEEDDLF